MPRELVKSLRYQKEGWHPKPLPKSYQALSKPLGSSEGRPRKNCLLVFSI
jgi:hypothetical protein